VPGFIGAVLKALANAEITPAEGDSLASIIGKLQSAVTLVELEERLQQIEASTAPAPKSRSNAARPTRMILSTRFCGRSVNLPVQL
jgi:hypothetical protein